MLRRKKKKRQQKLRDEIIQAILLLKRVGSMKKSHTQQLHGVSSGRSLKGVCSVALHDMGYQCVCEQPEGPSTALTYSKGFCLAQAAFCSQEVQSFL